MKQKYSLKIVKFVMFTLMTITVSLANGQSIKPNPGNQIIELKATGLLSSPSMDLNQQYGGVMWRTVKTESKYTRRAIQFAFNLNENSTTFPTIAYLQGSEKHFKGTDKLSPYTGHAFGVEILNLAKGVDNIKARFDLFTGFDYYITEGLYLGSEVGFSTKLGLSPIELKSDGVTMAANLRFGYILK